MHTQLGNTGFTSAFACRYKTSKNNTLLTMCRKHDTNYNLPIDLHLQLICTNVCITVSLVHNKT